MVKDLDRSHGVIGLCRSWRARGRTEFAEAPKLRGLLVGKRIYSQSATFVECQFESDRGNKNYCNEGKNIRKIKTN